MAETGVSSSRRFGLGDRKVDEAFYEQHVLRLDSLRALAPPGWDTAAPEFDARSRQWVTPAKNQGSCGSCWAHAAVGTMESRLLKEGYPAFDLSEQQQVSCNTAMGGCGGGSGQSLMFYKTNRAWREADAPYAESATICPPNARTKTSADFPDAQGIPYLATGFYTVDRTVDAMKTSLVSDGPCYFRYDVHDDFYDYWEGKVTSPVYRQSTGAKLGGHAVLLIGWSDTKGAWLLKNSWGCQEGPSGDGTFWIAYDGHVNDLGFQAFNLSGLVAVLS